MLFGTRRQRPARAPWGAGLLMAVFFALTGYEYWVNAARQIQDDRGLEALRTDDLARIVGPTADPFDWPQWRGPQRDGIAPGDGLLAEWPDRGLPVLWRQKAGPGVSSLAVAGGRVFTLFQDGPNEVVICWDAEKGTERWRFPYESRFTREVDGPRSTPTVDDERVYTLGARGHLHCLEAKTGKKVWHSDLCADFGAEVPKWGFSSSPLVEDDLLLINPGASGGQSIVAFDKLTGKVRWKNLDDPAGYSSPVISTAANVRQVLFLTGTALVSLDPKTGAVYWRFPWNTPNEANVATPLVRGDCAFISSGYAQGCALVRVVKDGDGLAAQQIYKNNLMRNHYATSVFHDGTLYGFDEAYLTWMSFRAGKEDKKRRWKEGKFHRGTLLAVGNRLIVQGEDGDLALVEPSPDEYREKGHFSVSDKRCWTVPALAHGRLYVRDEAQVICLDLRKK